MRAEGGVGSGQLHLRDAMSCTKQAPRPAVGLCRDSRRCEEAHTGPRADPGTQRLQTACLAQGLHSWSRRVLLRLKGSPVPPGLQGVRAARRGWDDPKAGVGWMG